MPKTGLSSYKFTRSTNRNRRVDSNLLQSSSMVGTLTPSNPTTANTALSSSTTSSSSSHRNPLDTATSGSSSIAPFLQNDSAIPSNHIVSLLNILWKGGVGKTSLSFELAYELSVKHNLRVLLVDCDDGGHLTRLFLRAKTRIHNNNVHVVRNNNRVNANESEEEEDNDDGPYFRDDDPQYNRELRETVYRPVRPGGMGEDNQEPCYNLGEALEVSISGFAPPSVVTQVYHHCENLFLLPGATETSAWAEEAAFAWKIRAGEGIPGALYHTVQKTARSINADVIVYDTGPGFGTLNTLLLLTCDFFLHPVIPDFQTLGVLEKFNTRLSTEEQSAFHHNHRELLDRARNFNRNPLPQIRGEFLGFVVRRYNLGGKGIAEDYQHYIDEHKDLFTRERNGYRAKLVENRFRVDPSLNDKEGIFAKIPSLHRRQCIAESWGLPINGLIDHPNANIHRNGKRSHTSIKDLPQKLEEFTGAVRDVVLPRIQNHPNFRRG